MTKFRLPTQCSLHAQDYEQPRVRPIYSNRRPSTIQNHAPYFSQVVLFQRLRRSFFCLGQELTEILQTFNRIFRNFQIFKRKI